MCNVLDDYLKTYNPDVTEFHSDSSDFEGTASSLFTQKMSRRKPPMKTIYPSRNNNFKYQTCNDQPYLASENSSKETWGSVTTTISPNGSTIDVKLQKTYKNKKYKILDGGDQIETIKSKRSVIRHKVIPCLSNIFGRSSNNVKQMSIIKENPAENVTMDNGCQATCVNGEHKTRKFNRRQPYYAAQPVYAVERHIHAKSPPFQHTKIVREPLTTCKKVGNEHCDNICSLTSSSEEVETHRYFKKKTKRSKPKYNIVESDLGKEYFDRYEGRALNHIEQQYPAKMSPVPPYNNHVAPDQYQNQKKQKNAGNVPMNSSLNGSGIELGTACSGFWEYIVNKLNMKVQPQIRKVETTTSTVPFKPCSCSGDQTSSSDNTCCCPNCENSKLIRQDDCAPAPRQYKPEKTCRRRKKKKNKVECQCPPPPPPPPPKPCVVPEKPRPCQVSHDEVAGSLANKYNGEILCIHNPPCILINGCITIPPQHPEKEQCEATELYSVNTDSKENKFCYEDAQTQRPNCHSPHEKHNCQTMEVPEKPQCPNIDACCQCLTAPLEIKPQYNTKKNESCQYQVPQILKSLMSTDYDIHYHSSPLEARRQQTTDDDSRSNIHKHQATDIDNYQYWLSPKEIRRQETASPMSCQYRPSPTEIKKQAISSDDSREKVRKVVDTKKLKNKQTKQEKIVQSICSHNPPCEVVRTCCKTRIDPKLQNSCVHVPMCENVPLCLMELKNRYQNISSCECPHKPKCAEVPVCTRNYIVLTAKEEVATQVRPKTKMMCRHEPPCIMIPTCLARVCDSFIPYDAIPDCIHQPMCEMIPACCRKTAKEMVSFRSQYPSQCRIV